MLGAAVVAGALALAPDLPTGQIIDEVRCAGDPSQSYALYLPSAYTPDRSWPVIFAFDPAGLGRTPVDRYRAAAEQYGFIVAGSNNSRNGSPEIARTVAAMPNDVVSRFRVDDMRVYVAGMSGGARVAFSVAFASIGKIAGVIASSAGYPDDKPRKSLPFPVFATAGAEDFNRLEMRKLDRSLTSAHRLVIFKGGHVWLSSELAVEAVEWMEIEAMKSGAKPRDDTLIDRLFEKRMAAVGDRRDKDAFLALRAVAEDFKGLKDVAPIAARAAALGGDKAVRAELRRDEDEDKREERTLEHVWTAEGRLESGGDRTALLASLRGKWKALSDSAKGPDDTADRRFARRVLANLSASVRSKDPEYLKIVAEYRIGRGGAR